MDQGATGRVSMIETVDARVMLTRDDLLTNAELIESRVGDPEAELARLLLVRRFIAASFELTRALRAQTQCALVNHFGTAGTRSLTEATDVLYEALAEYALRCREVASEARKSWQDGAPEDWPPEGAVGFGGSKR